MTPRPPSILVSVVKCAAASAAALALAACASDFVTDPNRPHPPRAVDTPNTMGSGVGEVMAEPFDTLHIFDVDIPKTKNDPYVVHTVADRLNQPVVATSRPATAPAETQAAVAAAGTEIKIVDRQHPGDNFRITLDHEGNADLWVFCPTGIGFVVLERTADNWPAVIHLHLRYDADRAFTRLEGLTAAELTAVGGTVALKTAADKNTATADITIPGFARNPRIRIEWVDMYR